MNKKAKQEMIVRFEQMKPSFTQVYTQFVIIWSKFQGSDVAGGSECLGLWILSPEDM